MSPLNVLLLHSDPRNVHVSPAQHTPKHCNHTFGMSHCSYTKLDPRSSATGHPMPPLNVLLLHWDPRNVHVSPATHPPKHCNHTFGTQGCVLYESFRMIHVYFILRKGGSPVAGHRAINGPPSVVLLHRYPRNAHINPATHTHMCNHTVQPVQSV